MLDVIRRGFDGLDVAFEAQITSEFVKLLSEAKEQAIANKDSTLLEFGGAKMHVADSGSVGGYQFRCDTGHDGATWFFKKPHSKDKWGIRVSIKSLCLALYGLGGARAKVYEFLDAIGVYVPDRAESISRVDYCIDFLMPGFTLIPDNFVMHARSNRSDHTDLEMFRNGTSGRVSSVTVGKMPGRQIIVYDKRKEVIDKRKVYWWKIWSEARKNDKLPELDPGDKEGSQVWRVELRAGKEHLKKKWGVRHWSDLDDKLGDILQKAIAENRYTAPNVDTNRSRWPNHPLWDAVRDEVTDDLFEMSCGAEPTFIKEVIQEQHCHMLQGQITGLGASYAVMKGISPDDAETVPDIIADELRQYFKLQPGEFKKKMEKAVDRYVFIGPEAA